MSEISILSKFMKRMDLLWERFDKACNAIPRHDAHAHCRYSDYLDKFFVFYWTGFDSFANKRVSITKLEEIANRCHEGSVSYLEHTWQNTADSLMDHANMLCEKKSKSRALPALIGQLRDAEECFKKVRKRSKIESRIELYIEATKKLSDFIKKVEQIA
jgi:hypothetical protein